MRGSGSSEEGDEVLPFMLVPVRSALEHFTDQDIGDISDNLSRAGRVLWSRSPRLYVVLHSINQIHAIDAFIDEGVTGLAFPFTNRTLPHAFSDQTARQDLLERQYLVLSKILELEKGAKNHNFSRDSDVPFVKLSDLGSGGFGFVDRVRSAVSFKEYARKLIPRGPTFKKDKKALKGFENEQNNLRKFDRHHHVIRLVGSYTGPLFVGLIMSPIAEGIVLQRLGVKIPGIPLPISGLSVVSSLKCGQ